MDYELVPATDADYRTLRDIWEAAVRATHHFLSEADIEGFRSRLIRDYFPAAEITLARDVDGRIIGFMGQSGDRVEMLFVLPTHHRRGVGRRLLDAAVQKSRPLYLDVNEQNLAATVFYRRYGFSVVGRSDVDDEGNPFPIVHMVYR